MPASLPPAFSKYGLQCIATGGALVNATWGGASRYDNRGDTRNYYQMGAASTSLIVFGHSGFYIAPGAGEVLFGNDLSIQEAFENVSPNYYSPITHQANGIGNIPNGSPFVLSDPIGVFIAGDGAFYHRFCYTGTNGADILPGSSLPAPEAVGAATYLSHANVSQVNNTGALSNPGSGGANINAIHCPLVLGVPSQRQASVVVLGDSIANGQGDTQTLAGDIGFCMRGLASVNGHRVPCGMQTVGSWTFSFSSGQYAPRLATQWQFYTALLCEMGANDIANSDTLSQMQAYAQATWSTAKKQFTAYGKPLQVAQTLIMPRTTSTDSWATAANQTPVPGFATDNVRDQFNAWVKTQVGQGLLDAYIDVNQYVEDQSNHGCWITNGTANYPTVDGVHPSMALHILAAQAVNAWASHLSA